MGGTASVPSVESIDFVIKRIMGRRGRVPPTCPPKPRRRRKPMRA